jgi:two-component system, cell cycle sensor histidine kinase and response regulator CckA
VVPKALKASRPSTVLIHVRHITATSRTPPAKDAPGARLVVEAGPDAGRTFVLRGRAVIGREDASVLLEDIEVSRRHAEVVWANGYQVEDLGSRNGTWVNDDQAREPRPLASGDRIRVGLTVMLFEADDQPHEDPEPHLATLGRMTAGVVHDFNNVLAVVLGNAGHARNLLSQQEALSPAVAECLDDMVAAVSRASAMMPRLLATAQSAGRMSRVNSSLMFEEIGRVLGRVLPRAIRVVLEIEDAALIVADEVALHRIVMNLSVNARDAMEAGGLLTLRVQTGAPGKDKRFPGRPTVRLEVEDTGCGMDAPTSTRAFDSGFSTKGREGHGLGLGQAKQCVEEWGGVIDVDTEVGHGTRFRLTFPRALPQPRTQVARGGESTWSPRAGHVLLVDDESLLRKIARRVLEGAGMTVTEAPDGKEGVRAFAEADQRPDVVVLDLDMPGMGGEQAHRIIRGLDERVPVVILTGHRDESLAERLRAEGVRLVLRKPIPPKQLVELVQRLLAGDTSEAR